MNLRRVTNIELGKRYEMWFACRFPQYFEQMLRTRKFIYNWAISTAA